MFQSKKARKEAKNDLQVRMEKMGVDKQTRLNTGI
jgi:hypothetical protein